MEAALLAAALAGEADALAAAEAAELAGLARAFQATLLDSPAVPCPGARGGPRAPDPDLSRRAPARHAGQRAPRRLLRAGCARARAREPLHAHCIASSRQAPASASAARLHAPLVEQASAGAHLGGGGVGGPPRDEGVGRAATRGLTSRRGPGSLGRPSTARPPRSVPGGRAAAARRRRAVRRLRADPGPGARGPGPGARARGARGRAGRPRGRRLPRRARLCAGAALWRGRAVHALRGVRRAAGGGVSGRSRATSGARGRVSGQSSVAHVIGAGACSGCTACGLSGCRGARGRQGFWSWSGTPACMS